VVSPFDSAGAPTPLIAAAALASCDPKALLVSVLDRVLVNALARELATERSKSFSLT
jgi:hypothetical protein